jgi:thiol:disulfide interchange protein DsbD
MERFKQAMGFVMLAVAVWLFTVFTGRGEEASTALAWYLFVLAVAAWLFGVIPRRVVGAIVAVILAVGGYYYFLYGQLDAAPVAAGNAPGAPVAEGKIAWQTFSEEKLEAARKSGQTVFVDFTAGWCLNCKFFERTVLNSDAVTAAFRDNKVVAFRADWTNQDPTITKWLNKFDRVGVPLYLLYRPGEEQPVVQDALTRQGLLDELAHAGAPKISQK